MSTDQIFALVMSLFGLLGGGTAGTVALKQTKTRKSLQSEVEQLKLKIVALETKQKTQFRDLSSLDKKLDKVIESQDKLKDLIIELNRGDK